MYVYVYVNKLILSNFAQELKTPKFEEGFFKTTLYANSINMTYVHT